MTVRTNLHQIAPMPCARRHMLQIPREGQIDGLPALPPFFQAVRAPSLHHSKKALLAEDLPQREECNLNNALRRASVGL